jgi:hypothetical protein
VNAKADYVLVLKGNQGECFDDVQFFLDTQIKTKFKNTLIATLSQSMGAMVA